MNEVKYPSELLENLVNEFHRLPGVGRKTALRYALHLLKEDEADAMNLGNSILRFRAEVSKCRVCNNICDNDLCEICINTKRNHKLTKTVAAAIRKALTAGWQPGYGGGTFCIVWLETLPDI